MAVTGLIRVAYLITHMLANLLVFQGPGKINAYSALPARHRRRALGCAAGADRRVVLHIVAAVQLAARRQEARARSATPAGMSRRSPPLPPAPSAGAAR